MAYHACWTQKRHLSVKFVRHTAPAKLNSGQQAEESACQHLVSQGLTLLTRNYRCPCGELDLVMRDGQHIVFVEVRYRRHSHFGGGIESVTRSKKTKLIATALHYLQAHRLGNRNPARFDVIAMAPSDDTNGIQWIRNAFDAIW